MLLYVYRLTIFFIDIDIICYTLSGMFSSVTNFSFIDILTTNGGLFTNIMLAEMTTFKKTVYAVHGYSTYLPVWIILFQSLLIMAQHWGQRYFQRLQCLQR